MKPHLRFIKDVTKIDLSTLICNKKKEPLLRLISYHLDDILDNNIRDSRNLDRLYPIMQKRWCAYVTSDTAHTDNSLEKYVISQRECVEKYIEVSLNLKGLIRQMRSDGLLQPRKDESDTGMVDRIDSFFSMDSIFVSEDIDEKLSDLDKNERQKVVFMKNSAERIKDIIRLVDGIDKNGDVKLNDNSWAYIELWMNRNNIVNYQKALKFAVQARDDERGAAISTRQRVQHVRDVKWMTKEVGKLIYKGEHLQYDACRGLSEKWGWVQWKRVIRERSASEEQRRKGGRKVVKFSTVDESVLFNCVEDMWKYAQTNYGYTGCLPQFKNKWKKLPWFKKF